MTKMRVKEKWELIYDFGKDWKNSLSKIWTNEMDNHHGKELLPENIVDIIYQYKTNDGKYLFFSIDMLKELSNKPSLYKTKVEIKLLSKLPIVRRYTIWFDGKLDKNQVTEKLNSLDIKEQFLDMDLGVPIKWEILDTIWTVEKKDSIMFDTVYKSSLINEYPVIPITNDGVFIGGSNGITYNPRQHEEDYSDLTKMTDVELMNLKERIDEILFKRENNLTDDEYTYYLENENTIDVKDIKMYYKDRFIVKKNNIRKILKEKGMV